MLKSVPVWRCLVTVLCVVGVLMPAAVGAAADPSDELEDVQRELDDARSGLSGVERRKAVELDDLRALDHRRAELDAELAGLNERLAAAEAELEDSSAALNATTQELVATEEKLGRTRKQLRKDQAVFEQRARDTYMYGGRSAWTGITGVDNLEEFERGLKYARSMLVNDQKQVQRIAALERVVERMTADLADLQERRAAQRAADAEQRNAAAEIVAEREAVAAEVGAEAQKRRLLVAQLETDRRSYVAMVQNLEAESRNLEEELARIAAAERARALAERKAAAEAEAARVAAAAAARERALAAAAARNAAPPAPEPEPEPEPEPPAPPEPADTTGFAWPANGPKTSDFGWRTHPIFGTSRFHAGIDIGAGYGAPIIAATGGTVLSAGEQSGYGNTVVINHGNGIATLYAHQSSIAVSAGQTVGRGETIGYIGSTGYSTGPHLHFEVRVDGAPVDPMPYF